MIRTCRDFFICTIIINSKLTTTCFCIIFFYRTACKFRPTSKITSILFCANVENYNSPMTSALGLALALAQRCHCDFTHYKLAFSSINQEVTFSTKGWVSSSSMLMSTCSINAALSSSRSNLVSLSPYFSNCV